MSVLRHFSFVHHSSFDGRAKQHSPSYVALRARDGCCRYHHHHPQGHGIRSRGLCQAASSNSDITDSNTGLYSLGVQLRPYNDQEALAAVSNKSFACTLCGKCCTMAEDSEVWLSDQEVSAMANHLRLSTVAFTALYCQPYDKVPGWRLLLNKQQQQQQQQQQQRPATATAAGIAGQLTAAVCVFLDENTKGCTVYPVRPIQCSTYPWWPELMPEQHWKWEKDYMCEGFEHPDAEPLDQWAAAQQLQVATRHTIALEAAKPAGWDAGQQLYGETQQQQQQQQQDQQWQQRQQ